MTGDGVKGMRRGRGGGARGPRARASEARPSRTLHGADGRAGRVRATGADGEEPAGRGGLGLSVRALVVVVLVGIAVVLVVPSLFGWWQQQRDYRQLEAQVSQVRAENQQMREQLERWNDPAYIASQARARLGYVKPGETQYIVTDPQTAGGGEPSPQATMPTGPARPWTLVFAQSVANADAAKRR